MNRILSDNETFVNAEMLLKKHYQLRIHQVEDREFYHEVNRCIQKLTPNKGDACEDQAIKSELNYFQERRIAAMLQRIPEIVNDQFRLGNIQNKKAMFTIGLYHLNKIIQYLNENRIRIYPPLLTSTKHKNYYADLNLKKENFSVAIILPRTLLEDPKVLEMNRLDKIKFQM